MKHDQALELVHRAVRAAYPELADEVLDSLRLPHRPHEKEDGPLPMHQCPSCSKVWVPATTWAKAPADLEEAAKRALVSMRCDECRGAGFFAAPQSLSQLQHGAIGPMTLENIVRLFGAEGAIALARHLRLIG